MPPQPTRHRRTIGQFLEARGQKSLFPTKCEGGQESRLREGREICFHVCLLSVLLILAIFIVKPEIRAVLGVCHDALPLILDGTAISQAH
jgi:hypothetical protein